MIAGYSFRRVIEVSSARKPYQRHGKTCQADVVFTVTVDADIFPTLGAVGGDACTCISDAYAEVEIESFVQSKRIAVTRARTESRTSRLPPFAAEFKIEVMRRTVNADVVSR